ncbi:MAG: hypothetical protein AVDCRST_MAG19-4697, partial [uncultured Thermomicrobiales bacterium]
ERSRRAWPAPPRRGRRSRPRRGSDPARRAGARAGMDRP